MQQFLGSLQGILLSGGNRLSYPYQGRRIPFFDPFVGIRRISASFRATPYGAPLIAVMTSVTAPDCGRVPNGAPL